eukprot:gene14484-4270_t
MGIETHQVRLEFLRNFLALTAEERAEKFENSWSIMADSTARKSLLAQLKKVNDKLDREASVEETTPMQGMASPGCISKPKKYQIPLFHVSTKQPSTYEKVHRLARKVVSERMDNELAPISAENNLWGKFYDAASVWTDSPDLTYDDLWMTYDNYKKIATDNVSDDAYWTSSLFNPQLFLQFPRDANGNGCVQVMELYSYIVKKGLLWRLRLLLEKFSVDTDGIDEHGML